MSIIVLQAVRGAYADIVDHLEAHGAQVVVVQPAPALGAAPIASRASLLRSLVSPRLLALRGRWTAADRLLVMGWLALPVLLLVRLGWLRRPQRLVVLGCFIHSDRWRGVVHAVMRQLKVPGLMFIAFSPGEARGWREGLDLPASAVHVHLWRQALGGLERPGAAQAEQGYVFAGGYSNRDYGLLLQALQGLPYPLRIVASARNEIPETTGDVCIELDVPEERFEQLLAGCALAVIPLRSTGDACGQSVLLRVLRSGKPLVATRHESIEAYLGGDFPGFVEPNNALALRTAIIKALSEAAFRDLLQQRARKAAEGIDGLGSPGAEVLNVMQAQATLTDIA